MNRLGHYKSIITEDGSSTFFNEEYGEAYHSKHGAYSEALHKHVIACNIPELAKTKHITILDLCFGLGYNSAVAIHEAHKVEPNCLLEIYALENDIEILSKIPSVEVPQELRMTMSKIGQITESPTEEESFFPVFAMQDRVAFKTGGFDLNLILGDAAITIDMFEDEIFDLVFFDPFSPKVCPELWQADFIKSVVEKVKPGAYISTYSCARIAKDNFAAAGCQILEGPAVGRRDGGVLARKL